MLNEKIIKLLDKDVKRNYTLLQLVLDNKDKEILDEELASLLFIKSSLTYISKMVSKQNFDLNYKNENVEVFIENKLNNVKKIIENELKDTIDFLNYYGNEIEKEMAID